jgi:hydroxymethylpyrimidine/phosphomethylpyrimidine kinase
MLGSAETIKVLAKMVEKHKIPTLVVDPVRSN